MLLMLTCYFLSFTTCPRNRKHKCSTPTHPSCVSFSWVLAHLFTFSRMCSGSVGLFTISSRLKPSSVHEKLPNRLGNLLLWLLRSNIPRVSRCCLFFKSIFLQLFVRGAVSVCRTTCVCFSQMFWLCCHDDENKTQPERWLKNIDAVVVQIHVVFYLYHRVSH